MEIRVEAAPFLAVEMDRAGEARDQILQFRTAVGDRGGLRNIGTSSPWRRADSLSVRTAWAKASVVDIGSILLIGGDRNSGLGGRGFLSPPPCDGPPMATLEYRPAQQRVIDLLGRHHDDAPDLGPELAVELRAELKRRGSVPPS